MHKIDEFQTNWQGSWPELKEVREHIVSTKIQQNRCSADEMNTLHADLLNKQQLKHIVKVKHHCKDK